MKATCPVGEPGCPCRADGSCDAGACVKGACVAQDTLTPPAAPVCYSPCQSGLALSDGTYVPCPADGLMARCLDGKVCTEGSCTAPGAPAPACATELDCPDFQTCIAGKCYATCSTNADCSGGRSCYRHVCRAPCTAASDTCPTGTACVTTDGDTGFCLPIRRSDGQPQLAVAGTFTLSAESVALSSSRLSGTLVLRNDAPVGLEFTVRKLEHTEFPPEGPVRVTASPLPWLAMGAGTPTVVDQVTVFVEGNGGTAELKLAIASEPGLGRWEGRVEIANAKLGRRVVSLSYVTRPEGRWAGKMHTFANFGVAGLDAWMADRTSTSALSLVGNGFIQRWGAFRQGRITFDELQAVVTATLNESWRWESVRSLCRQGAACYPYHRSPGYATYVEALDSAPIPTAASELPIALNLRASDADPLQLVGKIVTAESLQYAGDPAVTLTFAADPSSCKGDVGSACIAPLASLDAQIRVGGRYVTTAADTGCARAQPGTFSQAAIPWLVPGFAEGSTLDAASGVRYRYECRDRLLPFGTGAEPVNLSFAQANPIPDGRPRVRRLELVDGALINGDTLLILYRERFEESFLGPKDTAGFAAYGFMTLTRSPAELDATAYQGHAASDARTPPEGVLGTACTPAIVEKVLGQGAAVLDNPDALATGVLDGIAPGQDPVPLDGSQPEKVHYLCHDTGLFDGGPNDKAGLDVKVACPAGSGVTFFTNTLDRGQIADLPCQQAGSCQETLDLWRANATFGLRLDPIWRCALDPSTLQRGVYCDTDRLDLRSQKEFYAKASNAVFVPLLTAIDAAFRYKTQFRSRTGATVGFAPEICVPDSNAIPYCYDPPAIEEARARVDCALDLFSRADVSLGATARSELRSFLVTAFGYSQDLTGTVPITYDGFERLDAELLIMLGDEAYTRAFASRFDLAGSRMVSFQGSLFEPNGINLAGGAGNEMYNLYQAAQYYQTALDRFYALSGYLWQSVQAMGTDASRNFVTKETVVAYFDKLIRASTQKSRAWSEVAKRYQSFNRPDLARHVAERAYSAAYLESIVLSRMMLRVVSVADPADRDFIRSRAELAALGYRAALLDMREAYARIKDDPTYFGFAPDFIPFPALEPGDVNAFTKLLSAAKASAADAGKKEEVALSSTRAFDTDAAQFQAELIRIRNNYESQLADICGTFLGDDGLVHPATRTYAHLNEIGRLMGNPCGRVGNGKLHAAMGELELVGLDMKGVAAQYDRVLAEIEIERARVEQQCGLALKLADYRWAAQGQVATLEAAVRDAQRTQGDLGRYLAKIEQLASLANCSVGTSSSCPQAAAAAATYVATYTVQTAAFAALDAEISSAQDEISLINRTTTRWESQQQCEVMRTDSDAAVKKLLLDLASLDLEALKTQYRMKLAFADVQRLTNDATRTLAEQEETEQQTINVEAARNDPNVRIYKNDAVILADQTFTEAVADAYKATKVLEYYTSQSYAHLVDLFLIRMVAHGDYNLETYLSELENAYREFQQQYGNPDTRVEIVSLRDDVLAIPRLDGGGRSLSQASRIALFRAELGDSAHLDDRGYLTLPFSTSLARLSPLTRNHKILAVEAEIIGSDVGDTVGRVYVRQRGTGTVQSVTGEKRYYRLPERTAVLNPLFNGVRVFGPEVYRSDRMRDRPFVNTHWELILNQKDELANQDIDLQSLTDIRLYVYYTDFTQL